ncbi:MAG: PDZ domain-containing protein [Candidatus Sericytochromatia bacterium]|nr:PDZ domain-containing protein [Candidatus Sericytochromatia bacterium]
MPSRGSDARLWLVALLLWGLLSPAGARAADGRPPLPAGLGGFTLPAPFEGALGASGLLVRALPTMWLVTGVLVGGPASLAGIPDPRAARLRLVAVDGRAVEGLTRAELLEAFAEARGRVSVTLARKRAEDAEEVWLGPFALALAPAEAGTRRQEVAAARARLLPGGTRLKAAERLLLEAHQARADEDAPRLVATLAGLPDAGRSSEAIALLAEVHERRMAELVRVAEAAAADGRYERARLVLRGVQASGTWGSVRRARDAEYRAALASRKAWLTDKRRLEASRKAAEAARGRGPDTTPPARRIKL